MKNIVLLPLLFIISGCSTVGDALNPLTTTSDYKTTTNENNEIVTTYTKTAVVPHYYSYTPSKNYNIDPVVPTTPSYYAPTIQPQAPDYQNYDYGTPIAYKTIEQQELEKQQIEQGTKPSNDFKLLFFADLSKSKDSTHLGLHMGGEPNPYLLMRVGMSLFSSADWYAGFDASARLQLPLEKVKPFVGIGGYIGDAEKCVDINATTKHCEKKFLGAGYGELGFEVGNFSLFYRNYNLNRAGVTIPDQDFIGIGIRFDTDK